ncbi:MAG: IPT/TIG domain-containing protein [Anaerolineae bacterium]|jgi:hypothetical protein|nr:IPT/TIG domain-containing protein [Anaerolineae bacterium]
MMTKWRNALTAALISLFALMGVVIAQEPGTSPEQPIRQPCVVTFDRMYPRQFTTGTPGTLTIEGSGFESSRNPVVSVIGFRALTTTVLNSERIIATIPADIPPRDVYRIAISQPGCGDPIYSTTNPRNFTVLAAPTPIPTEPILDIPTPMPTEPSLIARNFSASPSVVRPGETVTLTFEVFNQGTGIAFGVSAALDSGGAFIPSGGQATTLIPDIFPGGVAVVSLNAVAGSEAKGGPTSIPITIRYRSADGEALTSTAALSVTVEQVVDATQLILSRYEVTPNPAIPGQPLTLTVQIANTGTTVAERALLRVGAEGVLLAGAQGDTFSLADLQPGATASVNMPLIVKTDAKPGPQPQPYSIAFTENGEAKTLEGTITIEIARVVEERPLILIDSYTIDRDPLEPGDAFVLTLTLKNAGTINAIGMLVTFGTVESSGGGGGGGDPDGGSGNGSGNGSTTSTTPSTTFAPMGTGGTIFIGDVQADTDTTFEQQFMVNGSTNTGIYSLPITLRYQTEDGRQIQDNLRASVVVIKPPALRFTLQAPPLDTVNVGDAITLAYDIVNNGQSLIDLTNATTTAENADVVDGAETFIGSIAAADQGTYTTTVIPNAEGEVTITVTFRYIDELNGERAVEYVYTVNALMPPPLPTDNFIPIDPIPTPEPEEPVDDSNFLGRLLLGLLGLGS